MLIRTRPDVDDRSDGRGDSTAWFWPLRRWQVSTAMSPAEIASALKAFDTGWILFGNEIPGLDGLRVRGWVQTSGFQIRVLPQWQHAYVPWVLGKITAVPEGSHLQVVMRPAVGRLLYLVLAFVFIGLVEAPWFAILAALLSHVGCLSLGFRPEVQLLEARLRHLIPGRWELQP